MACSALATGCGRFRLALGVLGKMSAVSVASQSRAYLRRPYFSVSGYGASRAASWISFNDVPSLSFQSTRPLLLLPSRAPDAVEGDLNS